MTEEQKAEEAFTNELRLLMLKHKPNGVWQTWMSKNGERVIILKRKDGSAE